MQQTYHFIGIGGIGMSALARILLQKGDKVTGSDRSTTHVTEALTTLGAQVYAEHSADWIASQEAVIYSTAVSTENPEFQEASLRKLPLLHRSDLLAQLMEDYAPLLVAGSHGKTTTTALLAHLCVFCGLDPSYAIGGSALNLSHHGHHGKGLYFIAEADESDGSFIKYSGFGAIITNISNDHLDFWKTEESLELGFRAFSEKVRSKEHLFFCKDNEALARLQIPGMSYGFSKEADLCIRNYRQEGFTSVFTLTFKGEVYQEIKIPLIGRHNALNAAAVFGLGLQLKLPPDQIRLAFASFAGVKRRAERIGEQSEVLVYDDYAHHPNEIIATLNGFKQTADGRRLVVIFQPHRYSRTRDCLEAFVTAFDAADELVITDIYGAGEAPIPGITAETLASLIGKRRQVTYVPKSDLLETLCKKVGVHDLCVTMGAGDIWNVGRSLLQELQRSPPRQLKVALLYGGASVEHNVSCSSVTYAQKHLDPRLYQIEPFYIGRDGVFKRSLEELRSCDFAFPILHGTYGEDGSMQGFLEILGIPYIGSDFRSAPLCMNKAISKHLAARHGIYVSPFVDFSKADWALRHEEILEEIISTLKFPLFTKGVHLGSSISVRRVTNTEELLEGIAYALTFDDHFLVEEEVVGREIEFALLGIESIFVSDPCEIQKTSEMHTYETKYGALATNLTLRAPLDEEVLRSGRALAVKLYRLLGCSGFARIDCFVENSGRIVFNEINPIPGLTPTSAYPQMVETEGVAPADFLNRLVRYGLARKRAHDALYKAVCV